MFQAIIPAVRVAVPTIKMVGSTAMRTVEIGNLVYTGMLAGAGAIAATKATTRLAVKGMHRFSRYHHERRIIRALESLDEAMIALEDEIDAFHQAVV